MDRRLRVIKPYSREFEHPLVVAKGTTIEVIKRNDGRYKEWYWCRSEDGIEAFVPEELVRVDGTTATFLADYDSSELTISEGETLIQLAEMGGWIWAKKSTGEKGWIPAENAAPYS